MSAAILRDGRRDVVHVLDISTGGLHLDGVTGVRLGEKLRIHLGGERLWVSVRWIKGRSCGVAFCKAENSTAALARLTVKSGLGRPVFREL